MTFLVLYSSIYFLSFNVFGYRKIKFKVMLVVLVELNFFLGDLDSAMSN